MATERALALQSRLDAARDKLDFELDKEAPQDKLVAAFQERVRELSEELKMYIVPTGTCHLQHVSA